MMVDAPASIFWRWWSFFLVIPLFSSFKVIFLLLLLLFSSLSILIASMTVVWRAIYIRHRARAFALEAFCFLSWMEHRIHNDRTEDA